MSWFLCNLIAMEEPGGKQGWQKLFEEDGKWCEEKMKWEKKLKIKSREKLWRQKKRVKLELEKGKIGGLSTYPSKAGIIKCLCQGTVFSFIQLWVLFVTDL